MFDDPRCSFQCGPEPALPFCNSIPWVHMCGMCTHGSLASIQGMGVEIEGEVLALVGSRAGPQRLFVTKALRSVI